MTAVLRHARYPAMRIIIPGTGQVVQFTGGVLVVNEDDPHYEVVMAVARKDPAISITTTGIEECPVCGEKFVGQMAKAHVARHLNQEHPGAKAASISKTEQVKHSAEHVCQVDAMVFKTEAALIEHTASVHAPRPPDEDDGPVSSRGSSFSTEIPAAKLKG